ncbi:hypothetical protein ACH444_33305 [Streptomyces microflavus]|uniref:hypothetical protein n=1 Tax=Streptomyces microflavus TaxID=1919 RepID=UPI0037A22A64
MDAEQLIEDMQSDIARYIDDTEIVERVRAGEINRERLQRLVTAEFYCQEAEFPTYGLLIGSHRHEAPAQLFGFTLYTVAKARRLLRPAIQSVGLRPEDLNVAAAGRLGHAVSLPALLTGPGEAALYLLTDLAVWCPVFAGLADVARGVDLVPEEVVDYLDSWGSEPPSEVTDGTAEVLTYALAQGENPDRILETARQVERSSAAYWDYVLRR